RLRGCCVDEPVIQARVAGLPGQRREVDAVGTRSTTQYGEFCGGSTNREGGLRLLISRCTHADLLVRIYATCWSVSSRAIHGAERLVGSRPNRLYSLAA